MNSLLLPAWLGLSVCSDMMPPSLPHCVKQHCAPLQVDDDALKDRRLAAIEACQLSLEHDFRADGLDPLLLDALAVLSADESSLDVILREQVSLR